LPCATCAPGCPDKQNSHAPRARPSPATGAARPRRGRRRTPPCSSRAPLLPSGGVRRRCRPARRRAGGGRARGGALANKRMRRKKGKEAGNVEWLSGQANRLPFLCCVVALPKIGTSSPRPQTHHRPPHRPRRVREQHTARVARQRAVRGEERRVPRACACAGESVCVCVCVPRLKGGALVS
jgi:hypothetical protein